ncbi:MAG: hypothetical protein Ct9H300mP4_09710 [Gammaproteobacteria bacterium]|nr:MAG: hypothetical protein Ct9H300mP4_09710 [Gammaproteobacteria bacterium]
MWAAQYFDFDKPRQWLTSGAWAQWVWLPAAIGAQFAQPDLMVIDVDGTADQNESGRIGNGYSL